jgi:hypothetical protein
METWHGWNWKATELERCHIVAESSGGYDEPDKFLLLCRTCHRESPMSNDAEIMIEWAKRRESWLDRVTREVKAGFKGRDDLFKLPLDVVDINRFNDFLRTREFDRHPASSQGDVVRALIPMLRSYLSHASEECFGC